MNLNQIKFFVSAYETGSFSATAKEFSVTTQAVSKAIGECERELGEQLFVRKSTGVAPTSFGASMYRRASAIVKEVEGIEALSQQRAAGEDDKAVRLAFCSPAFRGNERTISTVKAFIEDRLGFLADIALAGGAEGLALLRGGKVDGLITIGTYASDDTDCVSLFRVPTGIGVWEGHPLAGLEEVSLGDIERYPVAVSPAFDWFNFSILELYRKRGLAASLETIKTYAEYYDFVYKRNGIAFCVGFPSLGDDRYGTVVIPVRKQDAVSVPICLVGMKEGKSERYRAVEDLLSKAFSSGALKEPLDVIS